MNIKKSNIHPTAIVHKNSQIGSEVIIGPYCIIGENVKIGDSCKLHSHVIIDDTYCDIGINNEIYPFTSINKPQDLKFDNEPSKITIGNNNIIREYVTIQPGTAGDKMQTVIGNNCLLMAYTHVAHDCILEDFVQMANHATLAGHVKIGSYAIIGGLSAIHQFVNIGEHAIIGGMSAVEHDVIPYGNVKGDRATLNGLNIIGLKRRGFSREQINTLRSIYDDLFLGNGTMAERIKEISKNHANDDYVEILLNFMKRKDRKNILLPL